MSQLQKEIGVCITKLNADDESERETALRVLINLAIEGVTLKSSYNIADSTNDLIREGGGIGSIIPFLTSRNEVFQMLAAWALAHLAHHGLFRNK
jgi:hypothetical protein